MIDQNKGDTPLAPEETTDNDKFPRYPVVNRVDSKDEFGANSINNTSTYVAGERDIISSALYLLRIAIKLNKSIITLIIKDKNNAYRQRLSIERVSRNSLDSSPIQV